MHLGSDDIVEQTPKVFHRAKSVDSFEVVFPRFLCFLQLWVVKPPDPFRLQRVFAICIRHN